MLSIKELRDRAVIRPIKQAVEDQLLDLPGVTAVDIGERRVAGRGTGEQAIVVSVRRKRPVEQLAADACVPGDVLDIPVDVIQEEPVLHHAHCFAGARAGFPEERAGHGQRHPRQRQNSEHGGGAEHDHCREIGEVVGGTGIAPSRHISVVPPAVEVAGEYRRVGTLGAVVTGHAPAAVRMGLTTFDVACMDDAWSVGDRMLEPGGGHVYADLTRAALSGRVDAAAVTLGGELSHSCAVAGIGLVTGQSAAYPGEVVRKCGYGTGLSSGVVASADVTLQLDHGDALGVRVLREQLRVESTCPGVPFAGYGDAGAAVVSAEGRVVGLHVAGNRDGTAGFACPIGAVLAELDVELGLESSGISV